MKRVIIYTDGSYLAQSHTGGWAAMLIDQKSQARKTISGPLTEEGITNNRAEILAIIFALKALTQRCACLIWTDSNYVVQIAQGTHQPTANLDLWQEFNGLTNTETGHIVTVQWMRGHSGIPAQEECHVRAENAARRAAADRLSPVL